MEEQIKDILHQLVKGTRSVEDVNRIVEARVRRARHEASDRARLTEAMAMGLVMSGQAAELFGEHNRTQEYTDNVVDAIWEYADDLAAGAERLAAKKAESQQG